MNAELAREEWDFAALADDELCYCCFYEYTREAEWELWWRWRWMSAPAPGPMDENVWGSFSVVPVPTIQNLSLKPWFQHCFGSTDYSCEKYFLPPPWRTLTEEYRRNVVVVIERFIANRPHPTALEFIDPRDFAFRWGEFRCSETGDGVALDERGLARVSLQIDLRRNRDTEIVKEFAALIAELRRLAGERYPAGFQPPKEGGRGRKAEDLRQRLSALALMRLRHSLPTEQIRARIRAHAPHLRTWKQRDPNPEVRKKIDEARAQVLKWFRGYFPELGPNAKPEHFEPLPFTG